MQRVSKGTGRRFYVREELRGRLDSQMNRYGDRYRGEQARSFVAAPGIGTDRHAQPTERARTTRVDTLNRRRSEAETRTKDLVNRDGIREDLVYGILLAALLLFLICFLPSRFEIIRANRQNRAMDMQIRNTTAECVSIENDIKAKEESFVLEYEAAMIGLVADTGEKTIKIEVPGDANLSPPDYLFDALK